MELLQFDGSADVAGQAPPEGDPDDAHQPILIVALDGWTDAGRSGSMAAETLREQWEARRIGMFDSDGLYDYRDRRPLLEIDQGVLGQPDWPSLELFRLSPPSESPTTADAFLLTGAEPDFAWKQVCADLVEFVESSSMSRYVGLGAVPAPVPHTRVTRIITTGSDDELLGSYGRPHEQLTVPASCQVVIESALRDAGLATLGLWARIPHYVAGEYPAGAHALLRHLGNLEVGDIDLSDLLADAQEHRQRLDVAAKSSDEIVDHISELEHAYDEELDTDASGLATGLGPLPTGDEIAAEFEHFLRDQEGGGDEP